MRCAFLAGLIAVALYGGGPADVLVVVNQSSAISKSIGEYYARRRNIPARQVCPVTTTEQETITRAVYAREIEPPVGRCLIQGDLRERILYIVTTSGVPLRIEGKGGLAGDAASVDSELTLLYGRLKGANYGISGAIANPFYNKGDDVFRHPTFPIYLVTRLAAYDFEGVKAMIDRGFAARNIGKFVLDSTGEHAEGDEWLRDAAIKLPSSRTVFDDTKNVLSDISEVIAYASYGSNDRSRRTRRVGLKYLPGAIVTEYVSTNARTFKRPPENWNISTWDKPSLWFAGSPQTLIADYLTEGATGGAGHVWEPFLQFTPRPDKLLPAWYSGRNLAESFYLSIPALSWQNVVLGDPLCSLGKPSR